MKKIDFEQLAEKIVNKLEEGKEVVLFDTFSKEEGRELGLTINRLLKGKEHLKENLLIIVVPRQPT